MNRKQEIENKRNFVTGEYYHIFNRGMDGRNIFNDEKDLDRFMQSIVEFNVQDSIGSLYENYFNKKFGRSMSKSGKLVNFIAYCLNPNHYHFILEQVSDGGITKFMKSLGNGYTKYLNSKLNRKGAIFQGKFEERHIDNDDYMLHLSVYVNLNDRVHGLNGQTGLVKSRSSFDEYVKGKAGFCDKSIFSEQFIDWSKYGIYAESILPDIVEKKFMTEFDDLS